MRFLVGPVLLLSCALVSFAADAQSATPASTPLNAPMPTVDYLLTLGPYGALVWGAWLLGRGVKFNVVIELADRDRSSLDRIASALEKAHAE